MHYKGHRKGFTLIEILVVVGIIALLTAVAYVAFGGTLRKSRDTKRKYDLAQIGRFVVSSECYVPNAGAGDYDLKDLASELSVKYPPFAQLVKSLPKDPKIGNESVSGYRYVVSDDMQHCAMYANLENEKEPITLAGINAPTAGAGTGVLQAAHPGPNNTAIYYQIGK